MTVTRLLGLGATRVPLLQFHPRSAPLQGRTRVTLCGMTFRSHLDPDPRRSPPGAYWVAVGQRGCTVLPEESRSHRWAGVPAGVQAAERGPGLSHWPGADAPITTPQTPAHLPPQGLCGCAGVRAGAGGPDSSGGPGQCGAHCEGTRWILQLPCPWLGQPQWLRIRGMAPHQWSPLAGFGGRLAHPPTPLTLSLPRTPASATCIPCLAPAGVAPPSPCMAPTSGQGAAGG